MFGRTAHISDGQLIRLDDGQLPRMEARRLRRHLADCPQCRARRQALQCAIEAFAEVRPAADKDLARRPEDHRQRFSARLHEVAESTPAPLFIHRVRSGLAALAQWRLAARVAVPAGLVLLAALWYLPNRVTVSAEDILNRADRATFTRFRAATNPVALQRLRLQNVASGAGAGETVEIWRDARTGAVRQRGGGEMWSRLRAIQKEYNPRPDDLLSAEDYALWRRHLRDARDEVAREHLAGGTEVLVIRTANRQAREAEHLVAGDLVVRASDWIPLSRSFEVSDGGVIHELRLSEVEFSSLSRAQIPQGIFDDPGLLVEPNGHARTAPAAAAVMPTPQTAAPALSESELRELEATVRYAIHHLRLCLAGTLEVRRNGGHVWLTGSVDTRDQKDALLAALPVNGALSVSVRTVEEDAPASPGGGAVRRHLIRGGNASDEATNTGEARGDTNAAVVLRDPGLSNQIVTLSRSALVESWAIGRLTTAYPSLGDQSLSPNTRRLVLSMLRDHLGALRSDLDQGHKLLAAARRDTATVENGSGAGVAFAGVPPRNLAKNDRWNDVGGQLVRSMESLDALARHAFADTTAGAARQQQLASALERAMRDLSGWLTDFENTAFHEAVASGEGRR